MSRPPEMTIEEVFAHQLWLMGQVTEKQFGVNITLSYSPRKFRLLLEGSDVATQNLIIIARAIYEDLQRSRGMLDEHHSLVPVPPLLYGGDTFDPGISLLSFVKEPAPGHLRVVE